MTNCTNGQARRKPLNSHVDTARAFRTIESRFAAVLASGFPQGHARNRRGAAP